MLSRLAASPEREVGSVEIDNPFNSITRAMEIPPIHVDHVGEAVCESIERGDVHGPMGVWEMRRMLGWTEEDGSNTYDKVD